MSKFSPVRNAFSVLRRLNIFSLGVAGAVFYFTFFLLTPLLQWFGVNMGISDAEPLSREAGTVIGAGFAGLLAGYFILPGSSVRRIPNVFVGAWNYRRVAWVIAGLVMLGVAGKIARLAGGGYFHTERSATFLLSPFTSLIGYLDWVWLIAFGVALLVYYSLAREDAPHARRWGMVAGSLFAIGAIFAVFSCGREEIFLIALSYLIIRWYTKGMAWWKVYLAVFLLVAIVFPWGNICRNPAIGKYYLEPNSDTNVATLASGGIRLTTESFFSRINHSFTISRVTATNQPDFKSNFLIDIFTSLGPPRFLWESKPPSINARGNEFAHRLGVLAPDDMLTSVGPTLPGDFFINFGVAGVFVGMTLFGLLLKFLYAYLIVPGAQASSAILVYSMVWLILLRGLEVWAVPLVAGFIKILLLLLVLHLLIRKRPIAVAPVSL